MLIRVRANGELVRELLGISAVAEISLPPQPSLRIADLLTRGLPEFPAVPEPNQNATAIAILDSGLTAAHPLLAPAVGEATSVPRSLGDGSDDHGHGTLVAGLALYGDVASCIENGAFVPQLRIFRIRVLNERCKFDDAVLITTQMREAIQYLAATYGCRVFSLSLGDDSLPYRGGKVSPWAAILDTLARELNVVIVVSAGNFIYQPRPEEFADAHLNRFPRYLLEDEAKIIEPATAAIVLTVGALAHSANLPPGRPVELRPISAEHEPSPFTRSGPGLGGAIKPELCEIGGNKTYDGTLREIRSLNELAVVSMNREYLHRLFATDVGTSLAAPRVAHLAARLLEGFPNASANLIRALLVSSSLVPEPAGNCLDALGGPEAVRRVCGFGRPNLDLARFSEEDRAVLLSESELRHDNFHVYEIPIPDEFLTSRDARSIEVTLAYDPPVRHSRFDYLGVKMSFRLIRGRNLEEVIQTCRSQVGNQNPLDSLASTRWDCKMKPGPDAREGGTLQKAAFPMTRPPLEYGNTYHLVVRCEKKWARIEHEPQRYAVVATLRQERAVNIYQQVNQRIRAAARARVR